MRCFLAVLPLLFTAHPSFADDSIKLTEKTKMEFATEKKGQELLTTEDDFLKNVSLYDIQVRMQSDAKLTAKDLGEFQAGEVQAWTEEEKKKMSEAANDLSKSLAPFRLSLPDTIYLVKTSGKEEGDAAYTRSNAIFLPPGRVSRTGKALTQLLAHELFHAMSRHDKKLRNQMYAIIGFEPCNEIALPTEYKDRRITNPDAPLIDSFIELDVSGKKRTVVPVLYAKVKAFDPAEGSNLFTHLQFTTMVVEKNATTWAPLLENGNPIFINPKTNDSFFKKIGKNTGYIIHPEEVMADNFSFLIVEKKDLPNPEIQDRIKALIAR